MADLRAGSFSAWVDAFRWLAAASVLITHTGLRMLPPVSNMPTIPLPHLLYAFVAGFDHQAVMVFFVLSGLLVGGSVVREVTATGRFALGAYVLRRMIRLCIVVWPGLVFAGLCVSVALALEAERYGVLPPGIGAALDWPVLACNALFLQTAACPQFAGNGALWSLFNEVWYYLLFPPLLLAATGAMPVGRRVALGGAALGALAGLTAMQFTGASVGPYMLVWLVGVAAAALPRALVRRPWVAAGLFVGGSLAVRLLVRRSFAADHPLLSAGLDLLLATAFGNLLLTLRCCPALRPPPWPRMHGWLAGFSFSLYCTHIPVLALYVTLLAAGSGWQMGGQGVAPWLAVGGGLALCVAFAWCFAQVTERHTETVRAALMRPNPSRRLA